VAPAHVDDVNTYLNYVAFDMFCSFMFGAQYCTTATVVSADREVRARNAENELFVSAALGVFDMMNKMNLFPTEFLKSEYVPFMKSRMYREFEKEWTTVREVGLKKIHDFIGRYERNELNETERASYLTGAIVRQKETGGVSQEEMIELCLITPLVGVELTSSVTGGI